MMIVHAKIALNVNAARKKVAKVHYAQIVANVANVATVSVTLREIEKFASTTIYWMMVAH